MLQPPEQVEVEQPAPIKDEAIKQDVVERSQAKMSKASGATTTTIDWTPSEDLDLSNIKTKPPPRQSVDPTYRGWKEVGNYEEKDALTEEDEATDLLSHSSFFDTYLPAAAYGDWYHNVGFLILGGALSWIVGWFRFTLAPVFFIMVVFAILYRSSIKKYRTLLREEAQREFSIKSIEDDYETMDWCNVFLEKFWYFLEPSVSQIVCEQVNPILAASPAPAFIKALWIDSFTAGTKPPRIDCAKTLPGTDSDVVVMDWGCSFTPNALADSNNKQLKNRVNQKVIVKANLFGIEIPVAVSDVSFKVFLRIRMRMMSSFPHIETVNVSLLEPPQFDFNCKPFGDTIFNWEVLAMPGLLPFIHQMIKKYAGPMVFSPLSFQLNVQQLLAGNGLDSAIGVLAISAHSARGLKGFNYLGSTLDPYLTFGFQKKVLAQTSVKENTSRPVWDETVYIPIKSLSEPLSIAVIDYNDIRKDKQVGTIQFDLEALRENPEQHNLSGAFVRNNKPVGELQFGMHFMPTLEPEQQADGAIVPPPDLNTGIARIEVSGARHLKTKEKAASTYVELYYNKDLLVKTPVQKKTNDPAWNASHEKIVDNRAKSKVKVVVKNDKSKKTLGTVFVTLNELIDATQVQESWFPLSNGGEVHILATWKSVALTDASGAGGYTPPKGVVRISIDRAEDLRNLERIGKVDPYARVMVNGFQRCRTAAADSTLNPTWNEIHYVTVSSANQKLTLEVMDVESRSPDRTLGSFDVKLNDIVSKNEKGEYIEYVDTEKRESKLIHKSGPKGTLTYSLSFYPTLPVMSLEDIKEEEADAEEARKEAEEKAAKAAGEGDKTKVEEADVEEKNTDDSATDEENEAEDEESVRAAKLRLSLEELVEYKSGVLIYEVIEGSVGKDGVYMQAFFDNHGYNDYITPKLSRKDKKIGTTGDVVIKELDESQAYFRLTKDKEDNRAEKVLAELNIPTVELLRNAYNAPYTINIDGAANGSFKIQCSWIPVIYQTAIPPQDSHNNSGVVTIEVSNAENLISADRNGKSDPYVALYLNTDKESFLKTKKIKRTLDPVWNESGSTKVANFYDSVVKVVCNDWDIGPEKDDLLGIGYINLSEIYENNGETTEFTCPLTTEEGGDGGTVYLKGSFKPELVLNVLPSDASNIGDAFGTVGKGVGGVGKGIGKGVGGVGKGVGKGVGGVGKVFKKGLHLGKSDDA
ncbi:C2 domain-containing protein [Debaryomyces fabryi]|uniref:C2 domain-containing protein n=1 Tax=Debaryomyces fabryi TaxID=58627 RepID=A0A0V1PZ61_9ASCO|nr:C2 domain-containing protein [Debaryomyces fabryi]KSA01404.1 C2 domain-containing protein [Debaryomyces fabryi]